MQATQAIAKWSTTHEHDHHQGRHEDLLQGLGSRAACRVQSRLSRYLPSVRSSPMSSLLPLPSGSTDSGSLRPSDRELERTVDVMGDKDPEPSTESGQLQPLSRRTTGRPRKSGSLQGVNPRAWTDPGGTRRRGPADYRAFNEWRPHAHQRICSPVS